MHGKSKHEQDAHAPQQQGRQQTCHMHGLLGSRLLRQPPVQPHPLTLQLKRKCANEHPTTAGWRGQYIPHQESWVVNKFHGPFNSLPKLLREGKASRDKR